MKPEEVAAVVKSVVLLKGGRVALTEDNTIVLLEFELPEDIKVLQIGELDIFDVVAAELLVELGEDMKTEFAWQIGWEGEDWEGEREEEDSVALHIG
ncbi:hypothetical protein PPACK8108_LOCUS22854 [Phakopsora pachyrhizi]|uniref:Uncharacterized protein n=1 Tax=Phakopsora pachyrhizi TaxID=170000 RepID=A0AAV0ALJ7_PHAPC|nr:hypothetical protein PPACK8108_LOCUS2416 [Phakopsora pachyrhizi]CAH7687979.1 hypothetical protein PPACK8108_LOCUS22854 [Phakopsora pachyrhizi]